MALKILHLFLFGLVLLPFLQAQKKDLIILNDGESTPNDTGDIVDPEQVKIDAMISSLKRLPASELERLGLDVNDVYIAGTEKGDSVVAAWKQRQLELKAAVQSIVNPADEMKNLTSRLMDTKTETPEKVQVLYDLEYYLADVDNARDYHTIGAWPILVEFLSADKPTEVRAMTAWTIGSAVKNDYDYQLWTLESININSTDSNVTNTTCLELLIQAIVDSSKKLGEGEENIHKKETENLLKKALYAISAASRGNIDVQTKILNVDLKGTRTSVSEIVPIPEEPHCALVQGLIDIVSNVDTITPELMRKVFAYIADMLEERQFIRYQIGGEAEVLASLSEIEIQAFLQVQLVGDSIIESSEQWMEKSLAVLESYLQQAATIESQKDGDSDSDGNTYKSSTKLAIQASLKSLMVVTREILQQNTGNFNWQNTGKYNAVHLEDFVARAQKLGVEDEFVEDEDDDEEEEE